MARMTRCAVTVCLVPEARQGPFVLHGELTEHIRPSDACVTRQAFSLDAQISRNVSDGDNIARLPRTVGEPALLLQGIPRLIRLP